MRYCQHVLQLAIIIIEVTSAIENAGEWSAWGKWSECSVSCGYGMMKRQKTWQSPKTTSEEDQFRYEDIHECSTGVSCPVDGHWNFWGPWSECTKMCNGGTTTRQRECNAPKPQNGGKECEGKGLVTTSCNGWTCPDLPPNFDINKCNETTFMCQSRLQCIPEVNVCDNTLQCHDGSDEHQCSYWSSGSGTKSTTVILGTLCLVLSVLLLS